MFFRFPPIFSGGLIDLAIRTCNKSRQKIFEKLSKFSEKLFFQVATTPMCLTNINITLKSKSHFLSTTSFLPGLLGFFVNWTLQRQYWLYYNFFKNIVLVLQFFGLETSIECTICCPLSKKIQQCVLHRNLYYGWVHLISCGAYNNKFSLDPLFRSPQKTILSTVGECLTSEITSKIMKKHINFHVSIREIN